MDDRIPVLAAENFSRFKKLTTVVHFSWHLLVSVIISIFGIFLAFSWPESKRCEAYFILLYLRAGFWILTWLFDCIVKHKHENLRVYGYHDFYRQTKNHHTLPLKIVNLWNTAILAISAGINHYYGPEFSEKCIESYFSPVVYIAWFNLAETFILLIVHSTYIRLVLEFNKNMLPADALHGINTVTGSVGLMQRGGSQIELLEKQADLILYLKEHNQRINQKLMQMSNQLRTVHQIGPHPAI